MKTIILYATKYGSTEKVANRIREKIPGETVMANISKRHVPDLSAFDTVIVGGPIYIGKTLKPLTTFINKNLGELKKKRLALFICAGAEDPAQVEILLSALFPAELRDRAVYTGTMGGEMNMNNVNPLMRFVLKNMIKVKEGYSRLSEENIESLVRAVSM
ncbi:MAG: flavodoxin [Clostridiales bacterium]|nr:flavodoxin [Clostridiales bacterium]